MHTGGRETVQGPGARTGSLCDRGPERRVGGAIPPPIRISKKRTVIGAKMLEDPNVDVIDITTTE